MHRLTLVLIALTLAACEDVIDPADMTLSIVSGDGQTAPVVSSGAPASVSAYGPSYTSHNPAGTLPEPLVAKVDGTASTSTLVAPSGPNFVKVPAGTIVSFRAITPDSVTDDRDCGDPWVASRAPDDSGYVSTFWEKGTLAATCTMEVRLMVNDTAVVDTVFTATFEPGALVGEPFDPYWLGGSSIDGLVHFPRDMFEDEHGNRIRIRHEAAGIFAADSTELGWGIAKAASSTTGDTGTVRVYRMPADSLLCDCLATVDTVWDGGDWFLRLDRR